MWLIRPVVGFIALLVMVPISLALCVAAWALVKLSPAPLIEPKYKDDRWEP